MPSMSYGLDAVGASDATLAAMRRPIAFAATPSTSGGNLDTTLSAIDGATGQLDPAFNAHSLPITAWARAVFCSWRPPAVLAKLIDKCKERMQRQAPRQGVPSSSDSSGDSELRCANVRGPCTAAIAPAGRIGWTFVDYKTLVTDTGLELQMDKDSPAAIEKEVHLAVRRWRRANVAELFAATRHLVQPCSSENRAQKAATALKETSILEEICQTA